MSRLLTDRQAEELHKSIIAYLTANNLSDTATTLRTELNLPEDAFDSTTAKRYEGLLEKKWTSIARLQKKIMDLESRSNSLQTEVDNATPTSLFKRNLDPNSWLPTTPRYSLESHRNIINCIAFHPKFSSIASGSDDCTVKIWDWELGELEMTLKGHTRAVLDVDYGGPRNNVLLASCSSDLSIKLWDPADGYKNIRTLLGHDHIVSAVRFIPSKNFLVSASRDTDLRIWDVATGYCVKTVSGHDDWVRDISVSFDGNYLLSTGNDRTARLWDISSEQNPEHKLTAAGHEHFIECCALAPSSSNQYLTRSGGPKKPPSTRSADFMATGSRDKNIKIWDARGTCIMTLVGHDGWVQSVLFHPGGKYLLSVSDDKTLRCWDFSQDGKCVKTIRDAHEGFISCLSWPPEIVKNAPQTDGSVSEGQNKGSNGKPKNDATGESITDVEIRCIVATGGWDCKLNIFAK